MDSGTLTTIVVGFFTLVVLGASVFAVLRSSILKQNNKDLQDRVRILEDSKVSNEATIKSHEGKIAVLENLVTGRDLLAQLIEIGHDNGRKLQRILDLEFTGNRRPSPNNQPQ